MVQLDNLRQQSEKMAEAVSNDAARAPFYAQYLLAVETNAKYGVIPPLTEAQRQWSQAFDLAMCSGNPDHLPRGRPW
jgi:hypothetical protein